MAINRRPSGWLYDGNPDYKGTTVAERRAIQNQIDIEDQLIKNNKLLEEQIEQDKKLQQVQRTIALQQMREADAREREADARKCEKLGLDLEDIEEFMDSMVYQIIGHGYDEEETKIIMDTFNKDIKELKEQNIKLENKFFKTSSTKKKIEENNQEIEHKKKLMETVLRWNEEEKEENNRIDKINTDFNKFRETHYNKDVELLFKRLGYELDKVECKQEGKAEDYAEYFKTKILEN